MRHPSAFDTDAPGRFGVGLYAFEGHSTSHMLRANRRGRGKGGETGAAPSCAGEAYVGMVVESRIPAETEVERSLEC